MAGVSGSTVLFVPIDKEQPELPVTSVHMETLPFPGEKVVLESEPFFEVQVIQRQFFLGDVVRLFVRVLPPQGDY